LAKTIQAIRGMNDILPAQTDYWSYLEDTLRQVITSYGYNEIRFPVLEQTNLFKRTIGEVTDIIEKEMYTFEDRNGESLSLRPEGTAGCVRAGIEHGLFFNQIQRLWYLGPMFRYEKPQQGRFRQFFQFGVEAFGMQGPDIDAEQLLLTARIWESLGLSDQVVLQINSLGTCQSREKYREKIIEYFNENIDSLDEDSIRRLTTNPMRILDSKNPKMQLMLSAAPRMIDFLDEVSQAHFDQLRRFLDAAQIPYEINSRIVRGLDYYNMTVYEWVTDRLGAQGTLCAGGRYDTLVEHLGGKSTPAVGFALGLERVVTLLEAVYTPVSNPHVYIILVGSEAVAQGMIMSETLRTQFPEIRIVNDYTGGSFKSQFRRADKSGAKLALIIGQDEVQSNKVALKYLREERPQVTFSRDELNNCLLTAWLD
jgi:histidyl-tRNA synthetase